MLHDFNVLPQRHQLSKYSFGFILSSSDTHEKSVADKHSQACRVFYKASSTQPGFLCRSWFKTPYPQSVILGMTCSRVEVQQLHSHLQHIHFNCFYLFFLKVSETEKQHFMLVIAKRQGETESLRLQYLHSSNKVMTMVHFPEVKDADVNQERRSLYIGVFFVVAATNKLSNATNSVLALTMRIVDTWDMCLPFRYLCPFSPAFLQPFYSFLKSHNTFFPSHFQTHHEYEAAYTYCLAAITISHTVETVVAVLLWINCRL